MEKPERKEVSEREMKERKRRPGRPPSDSGVYDHHFTMRLGAEHLDILDRRGKGKPRAEVVRDMIVMWDKMMSKAGS